MTGHRRSGIALILVISIIGLMGITLGYLAYSCRLMLLQTDREYLKAVDRNLALSGLAWARDALRKPEAGSQKPEGSPIPQDLDVNEVGGPGARLSVVIADGNDKTAAVRIQTHVPSARHAVNRSRTFEVHRP
jgi:hypothetical protein